MRAKLLSSLSPTPALYLPKFAVLHIEDAILHRALHGPRAAPAVSARLWDWGRQRHRNVIAAEVTAWGRLPSLRLPLFGVWDEGQRLGHGRCPSALPLAAGQNACRESEGSSQGSARRERSTRSPAAAGLFRWQREQPRAEDARNEVPRYGGKAKGLWGAVCETLDTPLGRGSSPWSFLIPLGAATCLPSTSQQRAAPHTSS